MPKPQSAPNSPTPAKPRTRLTDVQCRTAKCPQGKERLRLYDEGGLYLEVLPSGRKGWYHKFRVNEGGKVKEKRMGLGGYSSVKLAEARDKRDENQRLLKEGKNPIEARRQTRQQAAGGATLTEVAEEWIAKSASGWRARYAAKVRRHGEHFLKPRLGRREMEGIAPLELKATVEAIHDKSMKGRKQTAKETLRMARQIWDWALATRATPGTFTRGNIAAPLISTKALASPEVTHYAGVTEPQDLALILRAIRGEGGRRATPWVWTALQLVPMLFLRQENIRERRWEEIDWKAATWTIPREQMKVKKQADFPFICPLPRQAIALLERLRPYTDNPGCGGWCFPSQRNPREKPISEAALPEALARCGIPPSKQMIHGFRATARTILRERLDFPKDVIEAQLDHAVTDANGRAYNRTQFLQQRRAMLQVWADYLDALADGVEPERAAEIAKAAKDGKAQQ